MDREDSLMWIVFDGLVKWIKTRHATYSFAGTIALMLTLAWLFSYQAQAFPTADPFNFIPPSPNPGGPDDAIEETLTQNGYGNEGVIQEEPFDLDDGIIWAMEVTFTFVDEPDARQRFENRADTFEITVTFPDGESETKTDYATNTGSKSISFFYDWSEDGGISWSEEGGNGLVVSVLCTEAGDHFPFFSPFDLRTIADDGNAYDILVYYKYTPGP